MIKIKLFGVREDEKDIANNWAKQNQVTLAFSEDILTLETVEQLKGFDAVSTQQTGILDDRIYERLHELGIKQIAQRSAGIDMYNLDKASEHNIIISNVPSYSPNSIAEYAVTSALQLIRKTQLIEHNVNKRDFRWQESIMAKEIKSLEIAIIGTGRIGQITAQIFNAFGAKIVGYDLYPNGDARHYIDYKESIEEAVTGADIVSLHMPATKDNYHLFDESLFDRFKDDAVFINTARGSIVDTKALINALNSGKISGAALDTYEHESTYIPKDFRNIDIEDPILVELLSRADVIFTPHIAFYTSTAVKNLVEGALDAALAVLTTGSCDTRVN